MPENYFNLSSKTAEAKLFQLDQGFKNGTYELDDLGSILPASLMVHDLEDLQPIGVSYMNNWGCERIGTSVSEINILGNAYYDKYFIKEEIVVIFKEIENILLEGDFSKQYNFLQRVKLHNCDEYKWFFSVCKLIKMKTSEETADKLMILASPMDGVDLMMNKMSKILEEDVFIKTNYLIFAILTKREKLIITMIANGRTSKDIAEDLFISVHTINTHRKNIIRKTGCNTFASLLKFAIAFDLV